MTDNNGAWCSTHQSPNIWTENKTGEQRCRNGIGPKGGGGAGTRRACNISTPKKAEIAGQKNQEIAGQKLNESWPRIAAWGREPSLKARLVLIPHMLIERILTAAPFTPEGRNQVIIAQDGLRSAASNKPGIKHLEEAIDQASEFLIPDQLADLIIGLIQAIRVVVNEEGENIDLASYNSDEYQSISPRHLLARPESLTS